MSNLFETIFCEGTHWCLNCLDFHFCSFKPKFESMIVDEQSMYDHMYLLLPDVQTTAYIFILATQNMSQWW